MDNVMRIGLIGCGGIGEIRAQALSRTKRLRLTVLADVDQARAAELSGRFGGQVCSDWRALIERADIDAVTVSTPPMLHAEMCIAALQAGKHVLCEKPLARNAGECAKMLDAAAANRRTLATGFNFRFFPSMLKARALLDSGIIGELDHIRAYAGYSAAEHNHAWLHDYGAVGGGALRDNGIHLIDLTHYFLGEVEEVRGFSSNHVWRFPNCEDNGFAVLRSTAGKLASVQASWTEWQGYQMRVEIYGSLGCIRASCFPMLTKITWSDQVGGKTRHKTHWFPRVHIVEKLKTYKWIGMESLVLEYEAFVDMVEGRPASSATGLDGLRAVEIADAVRLSDGSHAAEDSRLSRSPSGAD